MKSCGKTAYKSRDQAEKASKATNYVFRKKKQVRSKVVFYLCNKCGNYHLTSKNPEHYKNTSISNEEFNKKKIKEKIDEINRLNKEYGI